MDKHNDLLCEKEKQDCQESSGENHMQGLFFDLLACLGGGDNPNLPRNFKKKPMTGFCAILDAFNEAIKVRDVGSGTILEINSDEFLEKSNERDTSSYISDQTIPCSGCSTLPSSASTEDRQSSQTSSSQNFLQNHDVLDSYYSASDYDTEFKDAETDPKEKRKKKRKTRIKRIEESSSEEEHLWTSASAASLSEN